MHMYIPSSQDLSHQLKWSAKVISLLWGERRILFIFISPASISVPGKNFLFSFVPCEFPPSWRHCQLQKSTKLLKKKQIISWLKWFLSFDSPCPVLLWLSLASFMISPWTVSLIAIKHFILFLMTLTRLMAHKSMSPVLFLKLDTNSEFSTILGISIQISHYHFILNMFTPNLQPSHPTSSVIPSIWCFELFKVTELLLLLFQMEREVSWNDFLKGKQGLLSNQFLPKKAKQ